VLAAADEQHGPRLHARPTGVGAARPAVRAPPTAPGATTPRWSPPARGLHAWVTVHLWVFSPCGLHRHGPSHSMSRPFCTAVTWKSLGHAESWVFSGPRRALGAQRVRGALVVSAPRGAEQRRAVPAALLRRDRASETTGTAGAHCMETVRCASLPARASPSREWPAAFGGRRARLAVQTLRVETPRVCIFPGGDVCLLA